MAINAGWTFDYVAFNIDLPRLAALNKRWAINPPLHWLVAAYVGFKPPKQNPVIASPDDATQLENTLSEYPQAIIGPDVGIADGKYRINLDAFGSNPWQTT